MSLLWYLTTIMVCRDIAVVSGTYVGVRQRLYVIVTMFAARTTRRLLKRTKRHEIGRVSRGAVCPPADGSPRVFFMVFFEYQRKKMVRK